VTFTYPEIEAVMVPAVGRVYLTPNGPYPSITTVLGHSAPEEKKSVLANWRARVGNSKADQISQDAAQRGTNVHLMLERALNDEDPKLDDFPMEHQAMFKSLRLEVKKINKVIAQEVVLYSDLLAVAGRVDLIAEYQNRMSVVDYKTSSRVKSETDIGDYWLQTAFYAMAHNEMFGTNIDYVVIMMAVENHLPMIFRREIDEELVMQLFDRVESYYAKL
jgi:ATP-dependent exoDNAse (exonuclease V) beta subunit